MVGDLWLRRHHCCHFLGLELLSQTKAVLHLVLDVLMEEARAFEDLLVLLVVVALGARFINGGDDVVWSAVVILTRFGPFWPITATVPMVTAAGGRCGTGCWVARHYGELCDECPHPR